MGWMRQGRHSGGDLPRWSSERSQRPRVLLEHRDPAVLEILSDGLEEEGFEVLHCGGPRPEVGLGRQCPLLRGEACPGVDGADVVVTSLLVEDEEQGRIVVSLNNLPEGPPVLLEATQLQARQRFGPGETPTLRYPFTDAASLAAEIRGLLREREPEPVPLRA